jgi:hypothetical protein
MLSRSAPLPKGPRWAYEVKSGGFRSIVSTENGIACSQPPGPEHEVALPERSKLPAEWRRTQAFA